MKHKFHSLLRILRHPVDPGSVRVSRFTVVSHHFMSSREIQTPLGQDRLEQCVFRVPVGGELMSMCEFNANGHRDEFYHLITSPQRDHAGRAVPTQRCR